jgi:hypothetical protein
MIIKIVSSPKRKLWLRSVCGWLTGVALLSCVAGCGGSGTGTSSAAPAPLTLTLANPSLATFPGETSASIGFTLTGGVIAGALQPSVTGVPTGAKASITTGTTGNGGGPGTITIAAGTADPGTYTVTVSASDGVTTVSKPLSLVVGVTTVVSATTTGTFTEAMSTSFQLASYNDALFPNYPTIPSLLNTLAPQHTRMQVIDGDIPETAQGTWDFTTLDTTVQPILSASDHSPEFQIASAPTFAFQGMTTNFVNSTFLTDFADYSAHLVQYYNTGGFTANGTLYKSASANPIKYWGIYNEPNYNNVSPTEYVSIYNATVPAMLAVDPTIKIVALELGGGYASIDQNYVVPFVQGVTAHVDVMATHYYSTCQQTDTDATIMATVPGFGTDAKYIYSLMKANAALANVPVWVLENNVNADYSNNGQSMCNPSIKFVDDVRGSTAFFAAWRPYVFSRLGQAGVQALYHWDFAADPQYGEYNVDQATGQLQLSYWVDYWLGQLYPSSVSTSLLSSTNTDSGNVEVMAVKQASGEVVVMVADHAVANAADNNGAGVPRTVLVDVSALGSFTTAKQVTIDATTSAATGPTQQTVTFAPRMQVTLGGYGVTFLTLQ